MSKSLDKVAKTLVFLWCLIRCFKSTECWLGIGKKRSYPFVSTTAGTPAAGCLIATHDFITEGCACNFMGACSLDSNNEYESFKGNTATLETFIPNVKIFGQNPNRVVKICEPGEIGIIYDCENRIPLASTIVLTKTDYESGYKSKTDRKSGFDSSKIIDPRYFQNNNDYEGSSRHKPCYKNRQGKIFYDQDWIRALTSKTIGIQKDCDGSIKSKNAVIHRGHLIAAQYGRGGRVHETFLYTNVVPQFGILNSGAWNSHETRLIKWAKKHCGGFPLHILVGCVPSTFSSNQPRFFGNGGFSDYQETSNVKPGEKYAINVPKLMWTVACCGSGSNVKNTGFFAENLPERKILKRISPSQLLQYIKVYSVKNFKFFPVAGGHCEDDSKYEDIY